MHRLLLNQTEPLRHVAGFPGLGLLRALRPLPPASVGDGPSHRPGLVGALEGRSDTGSSRMPLRLASRARTIWQYWHASSLSGPLSTLTPVPGDQAALNFTPPLRQQGG